MATVKNADRHKRPIPLTGGRQLASGEEASGVDVTGGNEAAWIAAGSLVVTDGTNPPPIPPAVVVAITGVATAGWDNTHYFPPNCIVRDEGVSFLCTQGNVNHKPSVSPEYWYALDTDSDVFGAGDLIGGRVTTPPTAHVGDIRDGTAAAPVKIGTTASWSRTDATTRAEVDAMGPVGTDGPDGATVARFAIKGAAANEVQIVSGFFSAWQTSKYGGNGNDACPVYIFSRSTGTGRAIGGYNEVRREGAESRGQQNWELRSVNESGADDTYAPGAFSKSMAIEVNASGTNKSAVVLEVGNGFGQPFDTGIAFHPGSVTGATFRDDSESQRGVFITKAHAKGSIVVKAGAGPVVLNREEPTAGTHLLELFAAEGEAFDPIMKIGGVSAGVSAAVEWHNVAAQMKHFIAGGAKAFLPETGTGDGGVAFTPGKTWHAGAIGVAKSVLKLTEDSIGEYGHAPAKQQTVAGSRGGNAALASLLTALAATGRIVDTTTA